MKELSGTTSMDNSTPLRSLVELEAVYKARAWLAIVALRTRNVMLRDRRELVAWCEERRGHGVAYIEAQASTVMEMNQAPP